MLIRKLSILLIVTVLMIGCAGRNSFTSKLVKKEPTPEMEKQIFENIEMGKKLAEYDKAVWKASDLLLSKKTDSENLGKFFYLNDKVHFGSDKDEVFLTYYTIDFSNDKASNLIEYNIPKSNEILTLFSKAIDKSEELNMEFITSQESKYNYYAFEEPTAIIIWWIPAMTDDTDVLCGGIKATFDKSSLELTENKKLHQSVVKIPWNDPNLTDSDTVMRMHKILSDIPNEVDFAHFLIKQDIFSEHMILGKNYSFYLNKKNVPIIEFYSNKLPVEKVRIFGAIFEIQTDNTGKAIKVSLVETLNFDESPLIQPTEQFKKNCIDMLSSKKWNPAVRTFYYNLYYDNTSPNIPMIYNKNEKKYLHLW